jgi:hypothetical protein
MHLGIHTVSFDFPDATAPIEVTKAVPQANPGSRRLVAGQSGRYPLSLASPPADHGGMNDVSVVPPTPDPRRTARSPAVLDRTECLSLLKRQAVGRLGFMVDGWPTVLPVNYALDGEDIVIRTDAGTKLRALRHGAQVSVQIDAVDPLYRSGWSVLAFGYGQEVSDEADLSRTRSLPLQSWAGGEKDFWIRIRLVQITGRRLSKAWQYPDSPG